MTSELRITKKSDDEYEVTVLGPPLSTHRVTVLPEYYMSLTGGKVSEEVLLEKSFQFLLERESNTMILSRFELPIINRYFPEYESVIKNKW